MNLAEIKIRRNRVSVVCAVLFCVMILAALDGAMGYLRQPINSYAVFPGDSVKLTGPMAPDAVTISDMLVQTDTPDVSMAIIETLQEYWFGMRLWRGQIDVSRSTAPGTYAVRVLGRKDQRLFDDNTFRVIVYKDREAYLADSKSLILRNTGVSPWRVTAGMLALVFLGCLWLYRISREKDRLMAEIGEAEVYHVRRETNAVYIYFGLGRRDGINKGAKLLSSDPRTSKTEEAVVEDVSDTDSIARLSPLSGAHPGYIVRRV
jgi:hypothetical protein